MRESATTASAGWFVESTSNATTREFVRDRELLDAVLPEQRVLRKRAAQAARPSSSSCSSARVDEPPLERRHDDQVRGAERAGDDPDEDERDADPDAARERHRATPV